MNVRYPMANCEVLNITPQDDLWNLLLAHLERTDMARWIIEHGGKPKPDLIFLAIYEGQKAVGHISFRKQDLMAPATEWTNWQAIPVTNSDGEPLTELFIETFVVEPDCRRKGYGRALQQATLQYGRDFGCYQLRSWSATDKPANYSLKVSLGFGAHPAIYKTASGQEISGVYFVMRV